MRGGKLSGANRRGGVFGRVVCLCCAAGLLGAMSGTAIGQVSPDARGPLYGLSATTPLCDLIEALNDERYSVRERATALLMTSDTVSEEAILEAVEGNALSPEQALRVQRVLRAKFERSPRGAIGISFDVGPGRTVLRVGEVRPGFPAGDAGLIRTNDMFLSVDGAEVSPTTGMNMLVLTRTVSRDPGDTLPVVLARMPLTTSGLVGPLPPIEVVSVDLPLGRFDRLGTTTDRSVLQQAWAHRWERITSQHRVDTGMRSVSPTDGEASMMWRDRTLDVYAGRSHSGPIVGGPMHPQDLDAGAMRRLALQDRHNAMPRGALQVAGVRQQVVQQQQVGRVAQRQAIRREAGQVEIVVNQRGGVVVGAAGQRLAVAGNVGGVRMMNTPNQQMDEDDAEDGVREITERLRMLQDRLRGVLLAATRMDRSDESRRVAMREAEAIAAEIRELSDLLGAMVDAEIESTDAGAAPDRPHAERVQPGPFDLISPPPRRAR